MTCAEWTARRDKLQADYDAWLISGSITEAQTGDKRIRWSGGNKDALLAELRRAQFEVDRCNGVAGGRVFGVIPLNR